MMASPSRWPRIPSLALAALVAGAGVRVATLGFPGTGDLPAWTAWSHDVAAHGVTQAYGDESPPARHTFTFDGRSTSINYPPLAVYELAALRKAYGGGGSRSASDAGFTRALKGAVALADLGVAALIFLVVSRLRPERAWLAASFYWLNPAILVMTMLGYIDVFYAVPTLAALLAATAGSAVVAGVLTAAAAMTKPQALFAAPILAAALWQAGARETATRRLGAAFASGAITAAALAAPFVVAGRTLNMARALGSMLFHDMLSANTCNLWWLVGAAIQPLEGARHGLVGRLTAPVHIVPISYVTGLGYPNPRLFGVALTLAALAWACWAGRHAREPGLLAATGGFIVCAYVTLSVQVHENHFLLALPLLAIAAALRREFSGVFAAASVLFAANLYLFYGFTGDGPAPFVRTLAGIDTTLVVSVGACALLGWYGLVLRRVLATIPPALSPRASRALT